MAIVASYPDTMPEDMAEEIMARGILPLSGIGDALAALDVAAGLGVEKPVPQPLFLPGADAPGQVLGEAEAKGILSGFGVPVPRLVRAESAAAAGRGAAELGFPVVLKGEGLAHKTEAGAVVLNLESVEAVEKAAQDMAAESFLVEEMVPGAVGELLIGVTLDPAHGFLLTLGAGGTLAEVMADRVSLLLPVTEKDVVEALGQLAYAKVLAGYRGASAADIGAIAAAVLAVQDYVVAHREVVLEVEVNPLIVTPTGAVAVDALIRVKEEI